MSGPVVVAGLFVAIGGLLLFGACYGVYRLYKLHEVPLKSPYDVREGETVALEGEISDTTPTVTAPFSQTTCPIVYWEVSRYRGRTDGSNWSYLESGVKNAEELTLIVDGYEVPVELPESVSSGNLRILDTDETEGSAWQTVVGEQSEPPGHIKSFEEDHDIWSVESQLSSKNRRRYLEDWFARGEKVTVHGKVVPQSSSEVSASNFKLTPDGSDFLISGRNQSQMMKRRVLGITAASVIGGSMVGVGFLLL